MSGALLVEADRDALRELPKLARKASERFFKLTAFDLAGQIRRESPIDTGRLRGSIQMPTKVGAYDWGILINAHYWRPIQFGTKGYGPIYPKTKQALAFTWKGKHIVVDHVEWIGPRKANPFVDRGIEATSDRLETILDAAFAEVGL